MRVSNFSFCLGGGSCERREQERAPLSVAKSSLAALDWVLGPLYTQVQCRIASVSPLDSYQLLPYPDLRELLVWSGTILLLGFLMPSLPATLHLREHFFHGQVH